MSNMFCVILNFFRSVLVRNSAISSSDSRERHFFSSLVNKQLGTLGTIVCLQYGDTSFAEGSLERLDRNRKTAHEKSLASSPGIRHVPLAHGRPFRNIRIHLTFTGNCGVRFPEYESLQLSL